MCVVVGPLPDLINMRGQGLRSLPAHATKRYGHEQTSQESLMRTIITIVLIAIASFGLGEISQVVESKFLQVILIAGQFICIMSMVLVTVRGYPWRE